MREQPSLAVARDARCCAMQDSERCPKPAVYWVGKQPIDDYTFCCADHLHAVVTDGDTVHICAH